MFNDEFEKNQKPGLGINIYEQPQDKGIIAAAIEEDNGGYFGKPEFYDYSGVKLPENYCLDAGLLDEFNELAGRYNLSQKGADELMSMAVKLTQLTGDNYSKTLADQQRQKITEFKRALALDREIGGANLNKNLRTANIAYTQFADEELQNLLQESGLNCHPKVVKMFYDIGKKMQNDSIYRVNIPAAPKESREDILFPTMQ
ncbi:MAG: hypothetical protein LUH05_10330 [Candidatus Gastranaerophilales bacterium]|nr:hypothetical protein [Candidatus Gastranaerophilales bacterium]